MNSNNPNADYVLSNGAMVEVKTRRDEAGANVITELHVVIRRGKPVPLGGITARVLREIPLAYLANEAHAPQARLALNARDEALLLDLLRAYPSAQGRNPIKSIYLAATAYFYEKYLRQKPYTPNTTLSEVLDVPVRTVSTRVAKARSSGYLEKGATARLGGGGRGSLTPTAVRVIEEFLRGQENEH